MKNIDKLLFLPLFAALAIGCSSPTAMQSSEYDDVYYSSKDKTVIIDKRVADGSSENQNGTSDEISSATAGTTVPNPEYSEKNSGTAVAAEDYYSENYYDEDDYAYASRIRRFNAPYRGFSYYDAAYTDYYWYNRSPIYYGRSTFYDPFYAYDPFFPCYTCYGYPPFYGGINIIVGRPLYGGWGNPFGYYGGYGYNRGLYDGFYNRYYANSGWYRNNTNDDRNVQYGRRRDRSEVPAGNNSNVGNRPRRDVNSGGGGIMNGGNNGGNIARPSEGNTRNSRSRGGAAEIGNNTIPGTARPTDNPGGNSRGRRELNNNITVPEGSTNLPVERSGRELSNESVIPDSPGRRNRREVNQPAVQPRNGVNTETYTPAPQPERRQRRVDPAQPTQIQPQRQERTYEAPQRTYEAPRRQEPSYQPSQPQRQERSFEQPSSRPSYSPSGGSSGGGGGRRRD